MADGQVYVSKIGVENIIFQHNSAIIDLLVMKW